MTVLRLLAGGLNDRGYLQTVRKAPRSHVRIRAKQPARPELYDRTADPDVPQIPLDVALAWSVVANGVRFPNVSGSSRPQLLEACNVVEEYLSGRRDDCPARGIERPR